MELDLNRVDYLQVGLTHPRTMRLMPSPGGKAQQKVKKNDYDKQNVTACLNSISMP